MKSARVNASIFSTIRIIAVDAGLYAHPVPSAVNKCAVQLVVRIPAQLGSRSPVEPDFSGVEQSHSMTIAFASRVLPHLPDVTRL